MHRARVIQAGVYLGADRSFLRFESGSTRVILNALLWKLNVFLLIQMIYILCFPIMVATPLSRTSSCVLCLLPLWLPVFCFRPLLSSALVLCWKASHRIALIKLHRPASNQIIPHPPHPPIRSPTSLTTRYAADLLYGHTVIYSNEPSQPACQPASQQTRLRLVCRGLFSLSPFFTSPL